MRTPGHMLPYGSPPPKPSHTYTFKARCIDPLGGIKDEDLFRPSALSFIDGYADAREYGETGRFIPNHYTLDDQINYDAGFRAGLKVREHLKSLVQECFSGEAQEVQVTT